VLHLGDERGKGQIGDTFDLWSEQKTTPRTVEVFNTNETMEKMLVVKAQATN
jgi:hypothetical protein